VDKIKRIRLDILNPGATSLKSKSNMFICIMKPGMASSAMKANVIAHLWETELHGMTQEGKWENLPSYFTLVAVS